MVTTPWDQERLADIFCPYAMGRMATARVNKMRFVHYTTADAAMNILRTREVWMRKSSAMNDFMEVEHGLECVFAAYRGESGRKFKEALNGIFEGITGEIEQQFNTWTDDFRSNTYLTCVSEHDDFEDSFGRLSMWRAYSDRAGVALVMTGAPFLAPSDALKVSTSPVAYFSNETFVSEFERISANILDGSSFIKTQNRETIATVALNMLKFAAICTKHPGFREEKEWRIVFSPGWRESAHLKKDIQIINSIPQPIYKIPLRDIPSQGLAGIEIPALIDRIIIGPSQFPMVLYEAFCDLLRAAGTVEPERRVVVSSIPLR